MQAAQKTPPVEVAELLLPRTPAEKAPDPRAAQGQEQPEEAGWVALAALELRVAVSATAPEDTAADTRRASAETRCTDLARGATSAPSPTARPSLISIAEGEEAAVAMPSIPRSTTNRLRPWAGARVQSYSRGMHHSSTNRSRHNSLPITWGTRRWPRCVPSSKVSKCTPRRWPCINKTCTLPTKSQR